MAQDPVAAVQVLGPNQYLYQPLLPITRLALHTALGVAPFLLHPLPPWVRLEAATSINNIVDLYQDHFRPRHFRQLAGLVAKADPSKLQR